MRRYFEREKSRMIMSKMSGGTTKDKNLQEMQDVITAIQMKVSNQIRDQIIDSYYQKIR